MEHKMQAMGKPKIPPRRKETQVIPIRAKKIAPELPPGLAIE